MLRTFILFVMYCLPSLTCADEPALQNQLRNHPSPYLAMHQHDPVHWQAWNETTLQKARTLQRPLLISVGYFSCHWCHVMQRESFQDAKLAALINRYFIPVKIDRELLPALDEYLMDFVRLTRGQAGWPLNVFLTPDGYPLVGVTYLPRDEFYTLLDQLRQRWESGGVPLAKLAQQAARELYAVRESADREPATLPSFERQLRAQIEAMQNDMEGGFGQQSRFPMVSQLQALLWLREHRNEKAYDDFLRLTLDRMAGQGLHDLLDGGFFRYVIDPSWHTPHYEKMLYDNARLAQLYLQAAVAFDSAIYRDVGLRTVDFMVRRMQVPDGYFVSSFSAVDEQGREGYYYLWSDQELASILSDDELSAVKLAWFDEQNAISAYGKLPREQMPLPDVAERLQWPEQKVSAALASARVKMLQRRAQRSLPVDRKGLTAWNGLALSALASAYAASGDTAYVTQAEALVSFILERWWDGKRLVRAVQGEEVLAPATLEDYALVAQGLWDWRRQKPASVDQRVIEQMVRSAWQRYFVDDRWVMSDAALIPMLDERIALEDGALPSVTAVIVDLSRQLQGLRDDAGIQKKVRIHLQQVRTRLSDSAYWYAGYLGLLAADQPLR